MAGLKGTTIGGAQISPIHGNFFVNLGDAKAQDLISLIEIARNRVYQIFGLWLEREVRIVEEGIRIQKAA